MNSAPGLTLIATSRIPAPGSPRRASEPARIAIVSDSKGTTCSLTIPNGQFAAPGDQFAQQEQRGSAVLSAASLKHVRTDFHTLTGAVATSTLQGEAYDEQAFQYFLGLERKRSNRNGNAVALLLVKLARDPQQGEEIPDSVATRIFSALWLSLREVDFAGWYREKRIVGAVLVAGAGTGSDGGWQRVRERVAKLLADRLPPLVAGRLHVRMVEFR